MSARAWGQRIPPRSHLWRRVRPAWERVLGGLDRLEDLVLAHVWDVGDLFARRGVWVSTLSPPHPLVTANVLPLAASTHLPLMYALFFQVLAVMVLF